MTDGPGLPYQEDDDFFGAYQDEVLTVAVANGGTGYHINDVLTLLPGGTPLTGAGATVKVLTIGATGQVLTVVIDEPGADYVAGRNYGTSGGRGTGASFTVVTTTSQPVPPGGTPPGGTPPGMSDADKAAAQALLDAIEAEKQKLEDEAAKKKRNRTILIVAIGALLLLGVILFMVFRRKSVPVAVRAVAR